MLCIKLLISECRAWIFSFFGFGTKFRPLLKTCLSVSDRFVFLARITIALLLWVWAGLGVGLGMGSSLCSTNVSLNISGMCSVHVVGALYLFFL